MPFPPRPWPPQTPPAATPGVPALPTPPKLEFPNGGLIPSPGREVASLDFGRIIGGPLTAGIRAQAAAAMTTVEFIKQVGFRAPPPKGTKAATNGADPGVMEPIYVTFKYPKELMPYQPAVTEGLAGITVTEPGAGYTTAPALTLPNSVTGAVITVEVNGGAVSAIVIKDAGKGWKKSDTITLAAPPAAAAGAPAAPAPKQATAEINWRDAQEAKPAVYDTMALQVPLLTMLPIPYLRIEEMNLEFDVKIDQTESLNVTTTIDMDEGIGAGGGGGASGFTAAANFNASIAMQTTGTYSNSINRKYSMNVKVRATQAEMPEGLGRILGILEASILSQPFSTLVH